MDLSGGFRFWATLYPHLIGLKEKESPLGSDKVVIL